LIAIFPDIETVDIALLFHVLEHTSDQIGFLRNIKNVLKKNGYLIVEVPNVEEVMLETCPTYNDFYWMPVHPHYFNNKTLEYILRKAGFKEIEIVSGMEW
jgi:SAM-dependent methyltransferase